MSDKLLRKELIRLAHQNPELRPHLIPIIKGAADEAEEPEEKKDDAVDEKEAKKAALRRARLAAEEKEKEEEKSPEEKKAARLAQLRRQAAEEKDKEEEKVEETPEEKKAARLAFLRRQAAERMLAKMIGELWSTADGSISLKMAMRSGTGTAYFKKLMMAYNQRKLNISFDDTTLTFTIQKGPEEPLATV